MADGIVDHTPTDWANGVTALSAENLDNIEVALGKLAAGTWDGTSQTWVVGTAPNRVAFQVNPSGGLDIEVEQHGGAFTLRLSATALTWRHPNDTDGLVVSSTAARITTSGGINVFEHVAANLETTIQGGPNDGLRVGTGIVDLFGTMTPNVLAEAGQVRRCWVGRSGEDISALGADGDLWFGYQGITGNPGIAVKVGGTWDFIVGG